MPPPGPEYYAARRALWLTPRGARFGPQPPPVPTPTVQKLDKLLRSPDAVNSNEVWEGVGPVWKAIDAGQKLKQPLPMKLIIKLLHAAWLRDSTWPAGAEAPQTDDIMTDLPSSFFLPPPIKPALKKQLQSTPKDNSVL
ncbi:hypothetical protein BDN72DRAFT_764297 [Pluteus cervinus]|uniref:Uncharacterized protein n=1 Tax=Pluteus cervinus TaxID=181527 RepID=A0ACD3B2E6_9AGAR|nr:hypothetical protein BDN72DRAFT_764297 [Pluteus cervinus]